MQQPTLSSQLAPLMLCHNSQLRTFYVEFVKLHASFITDVLCECSTLRWLNLYQVDLDEPAIHALTRGFMDGKLRLTTLRLTVGSEFLTAHLYNAAWQWLLTADSLVKLCLLCFADSPWQPAPDELAAVEGLVGAVAQRGAGGRPCKRVCLGYYTHAEGLRVFQFVEQHGVEGVVHVSALIRARLIRAVASSVVLVNVCE